MTTDLRLRVLQSIDGIAADQWNACALAAAVSAKHEVAAKSEESPRKIQNNPFVQHEFLCALEQSQSVGRGTGWKPMHLLAEDAAGRTVGAAPCYLKAHSRGEYVFDHSWADAYARAGGNYYPKLQVAVPFTPATGPRLLARGEDGRQEAVKKALGAGLVALCGQLEASSAHATFLLEAEARLLASQGFLLRNDQQFHWENAGYSSFEDFLAVLTSRKRKAIRRERAAANANGITLHWLTGNELTEAVWDAFFAFYMETGSRKWGRPYLTRAFYSMVSEKMADRILLVMAKRAGRWIAGAINFIGGQTLFGRHWGAIEHHPFLHFEVCYYQAIDFAIQHRLSRVEAGAQGEHKLARGYLPVTTWSAHYIGDPALRRAVADYLKHERAYIRAAGAELATLGPFRKDLIVDPTC